MRKWALRWGCIFLCIFFGGWKLLSLYSDVVPSLFSQTYGQTARQLAEEKVRAEFAGKNDAPAIKNANVSATLREEVALRGQFGDSFAPLAALFAALALITGFLTLIVQAFYAQKARASQARDHVVALVANYHSMVARVNVPERDSPEPALGETRGKIIAMWQGVDGLYHLWKIFVYTEPESRSSLTYTSLIDRHELAYTSFEYQLDALFRTVYRVYVAIDLLEESDLNKKWQLAALVRANLSNVEQCWLFANCLTPRGAKAKKLFERYATFDNLGASHPALRRLGDTHLAQSAFSSDEAKKQFLLPR